MLTIKKQAIESFLIEENIRFKDKKSKGEFYMCSPFDHSDSDFRSSISYAKNGAFNCFKTNQHGNFFKFVKLVKRLRSIDEVKLWLFKQSWFVDSVLENIETATIDDSSTQQNNKSLNNNSLVLPEYFEKFHKNLADHKPYYNYLKQRNIREDVIDKLELYINPSMMHRRIVFPVYDNQNLIFYTGRTIDDKKISLRWYSQGLEGKDPVFFLNPSNPTFFIFEGMFDCLRIDGGVCTFGAMVSEGKVRKILDHMPSKIVVVMDSDNTGINSQIKLANLFSQYHSDVFVFDWINFSNYRYGEKDFSTLPEEFFRLAKYNDFIFRWNVAGQLKYKLNRQVNDRNNTV